MCFKSPNNPGNRQVTANSLAERGTHLGYSTACLHRGSAQCSRFSGAMAMSSQKWVQNLLGSQAECIHTTLKGFVCVLITINTTFQLGQFTNHKNKVHIKAGSRRPSERAVSGSVRQSCALAQAVSVFSSSRGLKQAHWICHLQSFIQQSHLISQLSMPAT